MRKTMVIEAPSGFVFFCNVGSLTVTERWNAPSTASCYNDDSQIQASTVFSFHCNVGSSIRTERWNASSNFESICDKEE